MEIDKPLISIVMAVYEPDIGWLSEQLKSLNSQTYYNLELIVQDDCSPTIPYETICSCVKECITAFSFRIGRNEKNMGSNKTFELLTREAVGEYIAYCDQDDIWIPEKLEVLHQRIVQSGAVMVCSDVEIIDSKGNHVAHGIGKVRKRHVFNTGSALASSLLYRNFVIGCTMLIDSRIAKEAIPFLDNMVHDHWLALYAAWKGKIEALDKMLIRYRLHEHNQTNVLTGVYTKQDYYNKRILLFQKRICEIQNRIPLPEINTAKEWARARCLWFQSKSGARTLWSLRRVNTTTTLFEIAIPWMPNKFFSLIIKLIQQGVL
ncbi:glycosyltransferase [Desulfitobacterium hafniense]|uniref:glycosyltransferase n=1 Tax=Desulfitobacterium hafniense TaxID=49338 RepID=UPI000368D634|nr:glycosyltransferase [Desulfitobacterium hafniense]